MKNKVISSLIWKLLERSGIVFAQFIIQIILARLLLPEDYGVVAIVAVFIAIANVFIQSGFNTALIQKKEVDDTDYSSVFYFSLGIALVIYVILFFTSPLIASFYKEPILVPVIRILSLRLFFGAINSIQQAVVARNLEFKKYFFGSLGGILISAVIGIYMAYKGFGVWALVVQQLVNIIGVVIILFFIVKWRPKLLFSFKKLKVLLSFGCKLLCSSLIDTLYRNIYDLVIGKVFSSASLAFYSKGKLFSGAIIQNMDSAVNSVMLPTLSKQQDNKVRLKSMMRRAIVTSAFIVCPLTVGMIVIARPMIEVVLTNKWIECVPFIQLLAVSYAFWPIQTANLQAINSIGRSDVYLKLEIIKKTLCVIVLVITVPMGLIPMAVGQIVLAVLSTLVTLYPNKKLLDYSYYEQFKDLIPSIILSIIMGVIIYLVAFLNLSSIITLIIQILLGIIIYILLAYILKLECFMYLLNTVKSFLKKRKN